MINKCINEEETVTPVCWETYPAHLGEKVCSYIDVSLPVLLQTTVSWEGEKLECVQRGEKQDRGWTHWLEGDKLHLVRITPEGGTDGLGGHGTRKIKSCVSCVKRHRCWQRSCRMIKQTATDPTLE